MTNNIRFIYNEDGFTAKTRLTKIPLFDLSDKLIREEDKKYKTLDEWIIQLKVKGYLKNSEIRCSVKVLQNFYQRKLE